MSLARNALGYATLTADADGVVSATEAEPGQVVAAGAPVVRLAHTDVKEAAVAVPENLVDRVRAAKARRRILGAARRRRRRRSLRELSPNADPTTRTYAARFSLPDAPAGGAARHERDGHARDGAPALARVPLGAVFDDGDRARRSGRSIAPPGAVAATPVVVAAERRRIAPISPRGAPEGAEIVALGVHKLDATEKVRIVETLAGL